MKYFILTFIIILFLTDTCKENIDQTRQEYLTIPEVISFYKLPGKCGEKMLCEDQEIKVRGYVDYLNVFDKDHYPQLPYEKFVMRDSLANTTLEIWAVSKNNSKIFKKIFDSNSDSRKMVYVSGIIEGWDAPTQTGCKRWIKINIKSEREILFK